MSKKIKGKLATFSNDGLGSELPQFDENTILKMREILNQAENKLRQVFRVEIKRLDNFIKDKYRVIPNEDSFIRWFEENKLYKNWKGLPKISDDDIFDAAQAYLKECKAKIKQRKQKKSKGVIENIVLEDAKYSLKNLVEYFSDDVFKPKTLKKDIEHVFSYPLEKPQGTLRLKISNKEFVFLLNEMKNSNIITSRNLFGIMAELGCFISNGGTVFKRNHLDQAQSQLKTTPLALETELFLINIIKNIKI